MIWITKLPYSKAYQSLRYILNLISLILNKDIDSKLLMPIAVNMTPIKYNYGEYIIKEGEIPKGLYIIKSG